MTEPPQSRGLSGEALAARREELNMTPAQVAGALLLSQRHVEALEAEEPAAFYNRNFYDQAKRRYAVLLGLAEADLPGAEEAPPVDAPPAPLRVTPAGSVDARPADAAATGLPIKPLVLALLALAAGVYVVSQGDSLVGLIRGALTPAPVAIAPQTLEQGSVTTEAVTPEGGDAPVPAAQDVPAGSAPNTDSPPPDATPVKPASGASKAVNEPEEQQQAAAAQAPNPGDSGFLFEAQRLCWVFARQTGGKETKVTLKAGQRLALPRQLSYLAVGDLSAVRILVDGEQRDFAAFSSDGRVARLGPAELRSLRAGSVPAPPDNATERSDVEVSHP